MHRTLSLVLLLAGVCPSSEALQPPPQPRTHKSDGYTGANALMRRYGRRSASDASVGVFACGDSALPSGAVQTFTVNATSRVLSGALCLSRDDSDNTVATASWCDGSPETTWMLQPCTASGCTAGSNESWIVSAMPDARVLGIPGAVGPWCDVWSIDNPTGSYHNELWAWNATDSTIRTLNTGGPPDIFEQCLTLLPPPPPPPPCTLSPRVQCHVGVWDTPPSRTPSAGVMDGPLLGNGDLGASLSGDLQWWLGKSDLWSTNTEVDNPIPSLHWDTFYTALGAASSSMWPSPSTGSWSLLSFAASQDIASATVSANVSLSNGADVLNLTLSAIIVRDENTLITTFSFTSSAPVTWRFSVASQTAYGLPVHAGVDETAEPLVIWASKQGVRATDNSMLVMPCDTNSYVIYPAVNTFAVDAVTSRVSVMNASASLCPAQVGPTKLSIRPCGPSGDASDWRLVQPSANTSAPAGALQLQSAANTSLCAWAMGPQYHASSGYVQIGECSQQTDSWWTWAPSLQQVQMNASQCLTAVPPNLNITVGVAVTVLNANDLSPVIVSNTSSRGSSAYMDVSLQPGMTYVALLSAATSRDTDWSVDPLAQALAQVRTYTGNISWLEARTSASAAWWSNFWSASSIQLGQDHQILEGAWYGFQYNLACTTAPGKVAPGLWGVWTVVDNNGWNGDHTLDYNAQANYYGSYSSNQPWQAQAYIDQITSDWHVAVSQRRATSSWQSKGADGAPGQMAQNMCCGYMQQPYEDPSICPPSVPGGFAGLEFTTHIGPFPGMYYFSDLSLRVVAAMSVKPLIDAVEFMGDLTFMNSTAYPAVAAVSDFFVSYVTWNATTNAFDILNSCAQEICGGGPNGEDNPHHDIAYLAKTLQAAISWAALLQINDPRVAHWQQLLAALPSYPTGSYGNSTVWLEARDTDTYFGSNAGGYNIVYTAALHPAESVTRSSDPSVQAVGWATVQALAPKNAWHPGNGLAMMWSPASRVAPQSQAEAVLSGWEAALTATMYANYYPDLGGGGIEQFGAADAINAALLQSGEGCMRFFAMWPVTSNASFAGLRGRGGFVVSASVTLGVVAAPIVIVADAQPASYPRNCSVLNPWTTSAGVLVQDAASGQNVTVTNGSAPNVWQFTALPGHSYHVSPL